MATLNLFELVIDGLTGNYGIVTRRCLEPHTDAHLVVAYTNGNFLPMCATKHQITVLLEPEQDLIFWHMGPALTHTLAAALLYYNPALNAKSLPADSLSTFRARVISLREQLCKAEQYSPSGATCAECRTFNEYAAPNQPNGVWICRGCSIFRHMAS